MRTLIVSDLHLGSVSHADLLRRPELRAALLDAIADAERVVLLGDVLELRHGPMRDALAAARPFFEDIGQALAGKELVIVAGNHDHALVEPWLARRGEEAESPQLGVEQLLEPALVSPVLERIAGWVSPARLRVTYPGLWLRPDVYATHGHYLDCHLTVPTLERLSVGVMSRVLGRPASGFDSVGDYEATVAPVFAWRDAVARDGPTGTALNGGATVTAWNALRADRNGLSGYQDLRRWLRARAIVGAFTLTVAGLNRAGIGQLHADLSAAELRRAGLRAMGEVAARVGLGDAYVVFGHTHRAGPLPGDDEHEWRGRDGARLVNAGSWTYAPIFLTEEPGESPYWPGVCVLVDDDGPPRVTRLLQDRTHAELRATGSRRGDPRREAGGEAAHAPADHELE
jgi:Calcineurin-like phosphoesterase superfamily domain